MVKTVREKGFRRDSWLEINLGHLEYNLKQIYSWFNKPLIPVVKADAYGHGAGLIARVLDTYDFVHAYAVASVDEAIKLREATLKTIMVLGISPDWALEQALENDIELTIVDLESAIKLNDIAKEQSKTVKVHIKLDTGMNRIGFKASVDDFKTTIQTIESLSHTKIQSLYTHFSDPVDQKFSQIQREQFEALTLGLDYPVHPASTKAAKLLPDMKSDYVRCGIELYGLDNPELKPLMSLYARISHIKTISKGESVSYKRTWVADKDTRIATLPLGYADGVPRALSNKIRAMVKGGEIKQVGLITMDQMMFDIGVDGEIKVGDQVELIGEHIAIEEWTEKLDTISYELVSALNLRLPKSYTRD